MGDNAPSKVVTDYEIASLLECLKRINHICFASIFIAKIELSKVCNYITLNLHNFMLS